MRAEKRRKDREFVGIYKGKFNKSVEILAFNVRFGGWVDFYFCPGKAQCLVVPLVGMRNCKSQMSVCFLQNC